MENYDSDDSEISEFSLLDYESESDKDNHNRTNAEYTITDDENDSDNDESSIEQGKLLLDYIKDDKSDILISPKLVNRHCPNYCISDEKLTMSKNMNRHTYYYYTDSDTDTDVSYFSILKFMCCGMMIPEKKYT